MGDHIVGMMWNKNEGDILPEIIASALQHVDTLVIADDGSTDNSWDIIQSASHHHKDQIEHISRYDFRDTWVQVIESDIMIMDTDVRTAISERAVGDTFVKWALINGVIPPDRDWDEFDEYPYWSKPIQDILTHGHWIEEMTYTFRPFNNLFFDRGPWRPWPKGFSQHLPANQEVRGDYTPLLAHYGYRGPTHVHKKYKGTKVRKYPSWDFTSTETTKASMYYFNGIWNSNAWPMSRKGYMERKGRLNDE
jgi:glycosyltransferase involved in cell wall biosynthesis